MRACVVSSRPRAPSLSAKAPTSRRDQILAEAARLFADRGFARVTVDDVGAACGISGPAIYHHFAGKEAMLGEMLVSISRYLLDRGQTIVAVGAEPEVTLRALVGAHAEFATTNPELITVQHRDLSHASDGDQRTVRRLQRTYVELWVDELVRHRADFDRRDGRTAVHAVFGLLNSTPFGGAVGPRSASLLGSLACTALGVTADPPVAG